MIKVQLGLDHQGEDNTQTRHRQRNSEQKIINYRLPRGSKAHCKQSFVRIQYSLTLKLARTNPNSDEWIWMTPYSALTNTAAQSFIGISVKTGIAHCAYEKELSIVF